ncbi:hypothetical protein AUK40_01765 [Candidatus Wirthbacteria bacterium CG2_30_54_11]|uniref:Glycosyltransferase 2-like domain-containing protein n=1 Tax=Candidatus Wirthbacteria bacterium CG2_30_54_11 TaxID=1817892 RepID=A0A1J5IMF4_9BACT|nr:MAG: hypothetical protein AUK40_01765 [Candidatus Wirthbacteria bacterium CG2_30_54_11]
MKPDISIVIPAYREEKLLPACLQSIKDQKGNFTVEVIVSILPGGDQTETIARASGAEVIIHDQKGGYNGRIVGFHRAKADIVATTDADAQLPSEWIENVMGCFGNDTSLVAITGPIRLNASPWFYRFGNTLLVPFTDIIYRMITGYFLCRAGNFAIRTDAYVRSGGFHPVPMEDIDLSRRLHKLGRIHYAFSLPVLVSDRRYRGRMGRFLWEWISSIVNYILLSRKEVTTTYEDIR